jgi:hypothetical protein
MKANKPKTKPSIHVSVTPEQLEFIDAICMDNGCSRAELLRSLINNFMDGFNEDWPHSEVSQ